MTPYEEFMNIARWMTPELGDADKEEKFWRLEEHSCNVSLKSHTDLRNTVIQDHHKLLDKAIQNEKCLMAAIQNKDMINFDEQYKRRTKIVKKIIRNIYSQPAELYLIEHQKKVN